MKVSEIKVSYQPKLKISEWPKLTTSWETAELLFEHWNKDTIALYETFKVMLLNNGNRVKGILTLSNGGLAGTIVDIRLVYGIVLKSASVAIILAHCHSGGTLEPSEADRKITAKVKKAGELFDFRVLDHIILTPDGDYYSFADNGLL